MSMANVLIFLDSNRRILRSECDEYIKERKPWDRKHTIFCGLAKVAKSGLFVPHLVNFTSETKPIVEVINSPNNQRGLIKLLKFPDW